MCDIIIGDMGDVPPAIMNISCINTYMYTYIDTTMGYLCAGVNES